MKIQRLLAGAGIASSAIGLANGQYRAAAIIRGAENFDNGNCPDVSGTVVFEQATEEGDMTVTVDIVGIRPGEHGFHVHEFGDETERDSLETIGRHFVSSCAPIDEEAAAQCERDSTHGFPPSEIRQSGDMGNLTATADCRIQGTFVFGQKKMSLSHETKSVVGRMVLIHEKADDGSQPTGNAGSVEAFGVLAVAEGTEEPLGVRVARPERIHCRMYKEGPFTVEGRVYMRGIVSPDQKTVVTEYQLSGLDAGKHAVHFMTRGDARNAPASLGSKFDVPELKLESIEASGEGKAEVKGSYKVPSSFGFSSVLGKAIVVRKTEAADSEIVGFGICGHAAPSTKIFEEEDDGSPDSSASSLGVASLLTVSLLRLLRA